MSLTAKPLKVTETIERWCCAQKDLKVYRGERSTERSMFFCQHCGQLWIEEPFTDAAGARDTHLVSVVPGSGRGSRQLTG